MIKWFYGGNSAEVTRDLFAVEFPNSPIPSASTIRNTIAQFEKTKTLISSKNKIIPEVDLENELEVQVCAFVEAYPTKSTRAISLELDISHTNVFNI